jgi:hypothetical protein
VIAGAIIGHACVLCLATDVLAIAWLVTVAPLAARFEAAPAAASARADNAGGAGPATTPAAGAARTAAGTTAAAGPGAAQDRPAVTPAIAQFFLPQRRDPPGAATLVYEPRCLGIAKVYYADAKAGLAAEREVAVLADIDPQLSRPLWEEAAQAEVRDRDLETVPEPGSLFAGVPSALGDPKSYAAWGADFREWLYRSQALRVLRSPSLEVTSRPGESEKDFRLRLQQGGRERRDQLLERIRQRYAARIGSLQERIRRAEQAVDREKEQAKQQKMQTAISVGVTILDAFLGGRKAVRRGTIGRATTAARGAGRILKEGQDVGRAEETVQALRQQLAELETQAAGESEALKAAVDPLSEELEALEVRPKKTDISVRVLSLGWAPYWRDERGGTTPAF